MNSMNPESFSSIQNNANSPHIVQQTRRLFSGGTSNRSALFRAVRADEIEVASNADGALVCKKTKDQARADGRIRGTPPTATEINEHIEKNHDSYFISATTNFDVARSFAGVFGRCVMIEFEEDDSKITTLNTESSFKQFTQRIDKSSNFKAAMAYAIRSAECLVHDCIPQENWREVAIEVLEAEIIGEGKRKKSKAASSSSISAPGSESFDTNLVKSLRADGRISGVETFSRFKLVANDQGSWYAYSGNPFAVESNFNDIALFMRQCAAQATAYRIYRYCGVLVPDHCMLRCDLRYQFPDEQFNAVMPLLLLAAPRDTLTTLKESAGSLAASAAACPLSEDEIVNRWIGVFVDCLLGNQSAFEEIELIPNQNPNQAMKVCRYDMQACFGQSWMSKKKLAKANIVIDWGKCTFSSLVAILNSTFVSDLCLQMNDIDTPQIVAALGQVVEKCTTLVSDKIVQQGFSNLPELTQADIAEIAATFQKRLAMLKQLLQKLTSKGRPNLSAAIATLLNERCESIYPVDCSVANFSLTTTASSAAFSPVEAKPLEIVLVGGHVNTIKNSVVMSVADSVSIDNPQVQHGLQMVPQLKSMPVTELKINIRTDKSELHANFGLVKASHLKLDDLSSASSESPAAGSRLAAQQAELERVLSLPGVNPNAALVSVGSGTKTIVNGSVLW